MNFSLAKYSIDKLYNWIETNGYSGWDPYDIRGTKLYTKYFYSKKTSSKIIRRSIDLLAEAFPFFMRKIMNIEPQTNAKAMGLLLNAYVNLYNVTQNDEYLNKAVYIARWLKVNHNTNYKGYSWGYPFNWNSIIYIPKDTPSAIASVTVGEGYYQLFKTNNNDEYLDICNKICTFLTKELYIHQEKEDEICFSYTPIDKYQVHNINLLVAEYLIKVGTLLGCDEYINLGKKAANFSVSQQNENGSIFYWSKQQNINNPNHLDLYHSGFEIRALYGIYKATGLEKYKVSYEKYLEFFLNNFFNENKLKIQPHKTYPIDIHACAEAINCLSTIYRDNKEVEKYLNFSLLFTINNMQTNEGWFIYKLYQYGKKVRIPYLRWGQAWMMKALSEYLLIENRKFIGNS